MTRVRHLVAVGVAAAVIIAAVVLMAAAPGRMAGVAASTTTPAASASTTTTSTPTTTSSTTAAASPAGATTASTTTGMASATTTASGFAIGGRFCLNCHQEQPRVSRVYPVGRTERVEGYVVKSIPGFAVVMNGTNVYHVRLPPVCGQPKPGEKVSLVVYIARGAEAGALHWFIGRATQCG